MDANEVRRFIEDLQSKNKDGKEEADDLLNFRGRHFAEMTKEARDLLNQAIDETDRTFVVEAWASEG